MTEPTAGKSPRAAASARTARGAVEAGAARASGERARRRATPLLSTDPADPTGPTDPTGSADPTGSVDPVAGSPDAPAAGARTAASYPRPAHRPRPVVTSGTQRKAAAQAGERRRPRRAPSAETPPTTQAATAGAGSPADPKDRARGRSEAAQAASTLAADTAAAMDGSRPVRRTSSVAARAKREADDRARSHLRLAPDPAARVGERAEARAMRSGQDAPPDPTVVAEADSLPTPGLEELVGAAVAAMRLAAEGAGIAPGDIERRIAEVLAYLRRRLDGAYEVDEFGYDADFTENILYPLLRPLYRRWFRVETRGIANIPAQGGALVVVNHSGTIAIDSLMVQLAIHDEHPQHRAMRALGADLVFQAPLLGLVSRRGGATLATNDDADRLLAKGELVGVFPEGFKGVGKPFKERYKLQRFGRGGFVSAALKAGVPIIPVSVVGAEEIAPMLGNMKTVARVLGLPYMPVTPTFPWLGPLGLLPLPSKWIIEFGAPIHTEKFGSAAAEDPMLVFDLTDQVRETIQQNLYALLMQRRSVFF
jgi:1-acyl-sn-glycerol-3-phosphate acyltransferase